MSPDFEDFLVAHDLLTAADEISPMAAAGVEGLVRLGHLLDVQDADALRRTARRAGWVAAELPDAPAPATDCEAASPGYTHRAVLYRALDRLAEKLDEHDAGGYVCPVDVACDVADLAEACTELARALSAP